MELKEFVKKVIIDLDKAISEANNETDREIRFKGVKEQRTAVEFDVAVTVESTGTGKGGGEIKVWGIGQTGTTGSIESKNSTVSRGIYNLLTIRFISCFNTKNVNCVSFNIKS